MNIEENNTLRFGDKIVIKGSLIQDQEEYNGFLCSKSFTQTNIQFQVIPNDILENSFESSSNINFLKNYNDLVFQIWPRLNFQAHKEFRQQKKRMRHTKKKIDKLTQEQNKNSNDIDYIIGDSRKQDHKDNYQTELQKLKEEEQYNENQNQLIEQKVKREKENNIHSLAQFTGQPVGYGSEVQIMHVDSGLFLTSQTLASDSEKSAYRFQISGDYAAGMLFRILPKFKLRNVGDTIQYRDQIIIQNVKLGFSVSFSGENAMKGNQEKEIQESNLYKLIEYKTNDKLSFTIDTFISQYSEVVWEFRKYASSTSEANKHHAMICGGDLVRFLHKETGGYLTADIAYNHPTQPEAYISSYSGPYEEEQYTVSSIWQIELISDYNRGVPAIIGLPNDPTNIYLRHFQTGRLLCFKEDQFLLAEGMEEKQQMMDFNSLLQFTNTKISDNQHLENQQCYHLSVQRNYINILTEPDQNFGNSNSKVNIPGFFQQLDDKDLYIQKQKINYVEDLNDGNALQIERISDQEKQDILFAFSAQPILNKFVNIFKYGKSKEEIKQQMTADLLFKVGRTLEKLIHFVCELDDNANLLDCHGFSIEKNQRILKNTSFIQLLTNLLYYPFKSKFYEPRNLSELQKNKNVKYIFQLSYVLIKFIIREYRPNELFASQWQINSFFKKTLFYPLILNRLELFMVQAMEYDNKVDILAEPTLTELIDNNETILKKKINETIIDKFVQLLIAQKSIKYIKLLRALINCDGKAMKLNQQIITKKLLDDNLDVKSFINPLEKTAQNKILITINKFSYDLESQRYETNQNNIEYMKYYAHLVYLFSDLCMDKQFIAINILKKYFTYDICFTIISNPLFGEKLRCAFSSLMKTCFIEGQKVQAINVPEYLKEWDNIYSEKDEAQIKQKQELLNRQLGFNQNQNAQITTLRRYVRTYTENPDLIQVKEYPLQFDKLKNFIMDYMNSISGEKLFQRIWLTEQNEFTLNVIKLCKSLFSYGMYTSIQDINLILKPLIQFLNATRDLRNQIQEKQLYTSSRVLSKVSSRYLDPDQNQQEENIPVSDTHRYEKTEENIILGLCRTNICDILELVNKIVLNWMGDKILIQFKKFYQDNKFGELTLLETVNMIRARLQYENALEQLDSNDKQSARKYAELKIKQPFDIFEQPLQWIRERVNSSEFSIDSIVQLKSKQESLSTIQTSQQNDQHTQTDKLINLFLIDLLLYDNTELVKASLQILEANFAKQRNLIEYLKEIQIFDDPYKIKILERAKDYYCQLNNLVDETENWYALDNKEGAKNSRIMISILDELFNFLIDQGVSEYQYMDEIVSDNQIFKRKQSEEVDEEGDEHKEGDILIDLRRDNSHKMPGVIRDESLNEDDIMHDKLKKLQSSNFNLSPFTNDANYYHEYMYRKNVRAEIQKMFRLLSIHKPLIELILIDQVQSSKDDQDNRRQILKKCFKVLALFCFENYLNQKLLTPHIDLILEYFKTDFDCLPQLLLNEIVRENELVLLDHQIVHKIIDTYSQIMNQQSLNDPQRAVLLEYLITFMKIRESIIRQNQIEVMISISNPKYRNILCILSPESMEKKSKELSQQIEKSLKIKGQLTQINIPYELQFFSQQLEVMSMACEDKNDATESKSQNIFSLETIWILLQNCEKCWPVRKSLLQFFFHVYLETEKDLDDKDLEYLSKNIRSYMKANICLINFQGQMPLKTQIQIYIFGVLLFCVKESANKSLIKLKEFVSTFYKSVLESFLRIQCILTEEDDENKLFIAQIFYIISQKKHIPKNSLDFEEIKESLLPEILANIKKYENKAMNLTVYQKSEKEQISKLGKLKSVSQKFHIIFSQLSETNTFIDESELEFKHLTKTIKGIQILSRKAFKNKNTINFEQLCKKLCTIIDPSNSKLSQEYYLVGLRIFRKIIEAENMSTKASAADWEGDSIYQSQITHKQNILAEYGVMKVVCNFLNTEFSQEVKNEAVLLGIAMLYGGNTICQQKLYEVLQEDQTNQVMICLCNMIETLQSKIKKAMSKRNRYFVERYRQQMEDMQKLKKAKSLGNDKVQQIQKQKEDQLKEKQYLKEREEQELLIKEVHASVNSYNEDEIIINLTRIYRLLQLFCEGHFLPLQNYVREQEQNGDINAKSINFIKLLSQNFGSYIRYMNDKTVSLGQQIIDFLVESVQGPCQMNQKCISDNKIVDHTKELLSSFQQHNDYVKRGIESNESKQNINDVVSKSTLLLVSLLEGNTEKEIPLYIDQQLDFRFIRRFLSNQYKQFVEEDLELDVNCTAVSDIIETISERCQTFSGQIENAFNMYILIATISDQLKRLNPGIESKAYKYINLRTDNLEDKAMEFFAKNTCSIEVFFQEKLARVFFIMQPACRNISKESRKKFMNEVERGTLNDKLGNLISESATFFTEMDHMTNLKGWFLHFTSNRFSKLKLFSTILSFLINILMVAVIDRRPVYNNSEINDKQQTIFTLDAFVVTYILGIIQLIVNLVMMVFWLVLNVPVILTDRWNEFTEKNQYLVNQRSETLLELLSHPRFFATYLTTYALKTKGPNYSKFQENGKLRFGNIWGYVKYYETSFMFLMRNGTFLYLVFYIACTILGFFFNNLIYSFQLLDIINQFPTLRNVTLAVESNANQLLKTFLLGVIIIFIYSVIGYTFAVDSYFFPSQGDGGENLCSNLFHCFLESLNLGLRNGGGVSESMRIQSFEEDNRSTFIFRVIFDVTFFALINVIFINIIFGIIIDTFAELRDKKSDVAEDMKNVCFICGLQRYTFDKNADGFYNHIERDHQLWNYIFYMYFLSKKDSTDYNGIETDVVTKIEKIDISWFPMMKAISLGVQDEKDEQNDKIVENLDEMSYGFQYLNERINNLQDLIKREQTFASKKSHQRQISSYK